MYVAVGTGGLVRDQDPHSPAGTQEQRQHTSHGHRAPSPQALLQEGLLSWWDVGGTMFSDGPGTAATCQELLALLRIHWHSWSSPGVDCREKEDADVPGLHLTGWETRSSCSTAPCAVQEFALFSLVTFVPH